MKNENDTKTTTTRTETTNRVKVSLLLPEDVIRASKACCERSGIAFDRLVEAAMIVEIVRGS